MDAIQYILISTGCLSIFYSLYLLISRKEANFRQLRFYLLASVLISVIIPFTKFEISIDYPVFKKETEIPSVKNIADYNLSDYLKTDYNLADKAHKSSSFLDADNLLKIITRIYLVGLFVLMARFVFSVGMLVIYYIKSKRVKDGNFILVYNTRFNSIFSFFHWIFINVEKSSEEELGQIVSHEKIHASQYHSLDLIVIELLSAVMWFNPLVWMMKKSMQLVHEYLADEGALGTGIDRLKYQALLINQISEERLICLSSSFNKSLIKKRMLMMNRRNFNQKSKLKILALVPASLLIFVVIALFNGVTSHTAKANEMHEKINSTAQAYSSSEVSEVLNLETPNDITATDSSTVKHCPDSVKKISRYQSGKPINASKVSYIDIHGDGALDAAMNIKMKKIDSISSAKLDSSKVKWVKRDNMVISVRGIRRSDKNDTIRSKAAIIVIPDTISEENNKPLGNNPVIRINPSNIDPKILYVIDGVPQPETFSKDSLNKAQIEGVRILPKLNNSKYEDYKEMGYESAILISTKKSKSETKFKE